MANDCFVFCGNVPVLSNIPPKKVRQLWTSGPHQNCHPQIDTLCARLEENVSDHLIDLLEIAVYIYVADQAFSRGGDAGQCEGKEWRRQFHFHIPVRHPDLWNSNDLQAPLKDAIQFLSADKYEFHFYKQDKPVSAQEYINFGEDQQPYFNADKVVLFSGGLDSLAGTIQELAENKCKLVLVTHRPNDKIGRPQFDLMRGLKTYFNPSDLLHVSLGINKDQSLTKDNTQAARSFLFSALAVCVASLFEKNTIYFYENGITSFNLPIAKQVLSTRASRTTHPKVLDQFSRFFTTLFDNEFHVLNPFMWKTKKEIVEIIGNQKCKDLLSWARSCSHTRHINNHHTHCGLCSQCVDRRYGEMASPFDHDLLAELYKFKLFTSPREESKEHGLAYLYSTLFMDIEHFDKDSFFSEFGEATRAFQYCHEPPHIASRKIFNLYKKQSENVCLCR